MNLDRLVGTTVGDYTLKRLLGQGGMGAVFLGWHVHMQLPYAVKVLRPDMTGESFLERFFLEARLGAQLKHENIVGMHYAGVAQLDGSTMPYLAMEYVEGESVRTAVKQAGGKLSPLASANVMSQALRGLGYAHRQKMIHRDIKPDNLMINRAGVVKIADFGLARSVGGESGLTLSGQVLGTPAYMSLEQWRSDKDIDGRTDIYSLGATWYHILAGKPPYAGDPYTILARLNAGPPPPIVESNPGCDEELGGIVMRMMAQHADNRYATAEEVLRAIDTWSRNVASPEEVEESLVLLVPDESRVLPMGEPPTDTLRPRQSGFVTPRPATARANASSTAQGTLLEIGGTPMPTAAASGRRSSRRTGVTDPDVYPPTPPDEAGAHARRGGHGMLIGVLVAIVIGLVGAFVAIALTPKPDGGNRNEPVADGRNTDANTATPGTNNTTDVGNAANTNAGTNSGPTPVDPPGETAAAAALRMALEANTPSVLRSFLADHGSSPEAAQARQRLDELDDAAATAAGAADTADAWTRYLNDFPDGRHHIDARDELDYYTARAAIEATPEDFGAMQRVMRDYIRAHEVGRRSNDLDALIQTMDAAHADAVIASADPARMTSYLRDASGSRPGADRVRAACTAVLLAQARETVAAHDATATRAAWQRYLDAGGERRNEARMWMRYPVVSDAMPPPVNNVNSVRIDAAGVTTARVTRDRLSIEVTWVPPGFVCTDFEADLYEEHEGYWLGSGEVTIAEWLAFCDVSHRDNTLWKDIRPLTRLRPVTQVDQAAALELCKHMGGDLPTEAEWLAAARGQSDAQPRMWPWGNDESLDLHRLALTGDAPIAARDRESLDIAPYGHVGLGGNVREWCAGAIVRGGSFRSGSIAGARVTQRQELPATTTADDLGFRICIRSR